MLLRFALILLLASGVVNAEENGNATDSADSTAPKKSPNNKKGKRVREKEAEGTEAANRFEADTVVKSRYQYDGEHLEVDPD